MVLPRPQVKFNSVVQGLKGTQRVLVEALIWVPTLPFQHAPKARNERKPPSTKICSALELKRVGNKGPAGDQHMSLLHADQGQPEVFEELIRVCQELPGKQPKAARVETRAQSSQPNL